MKKKEVVRQQNRIEAGGFKFGFTPRPITPDDNRGLTQVFLFDLVLAFVILIALVVTKAQHLACCGMFLLAAVVSIVMIWCVVWMAKFLGFSVLKACASGDDARNRR